MNEGYDIARIVEHVCNRNEECDSCIFVDGCMYATGETSNLAEALSDLWQNQIEY